MVVGGGETRQELIPFKHKEWSELAEWVYGVRRHGARELTVTKTAKTHEAPVNSKLLRMR